MGSRWSSPGEAGRPCRTVRPSSSSPITDDGALAVVTFLRGTPRARLFAVQMLVVGHQGDTHSEDDRRNWLEEAGFGVEVAGLDQLDQSLILARPS